MLQYIAFLRGVNISGKNKVDMKELKTLFDEIGFTNIKTYINSGNVIFSTDIEDVLGLIEICEKAIKNNFKLDIPVLVIPVQELREIIENAPEWWGTSDKEIYDNLILAIPPITVDIIINEVGDAKEEYERISHYKNAIYCSTNLKNFSKGRYSNTASSSINKNITIRTCNTIRKLLKLADSIKS